MTTQELGSHAALSDLSAAAPARIPGLPLSRPLRAWLGIEVIFGLLSLVTISLTPADTARHFAWPIKPEVTAALLGGFYFAAAFIYVLALFTRRWENVRVFIVASILFSSIEFAATLLHWERMSVGSTPFNVWFVSYVLPPPLFIGFYLWHERRNSAAPKAQDEPLAPWLRAGLVVLGTPLVLLGAAVFVQPDLLFPLMAWKFTPLTARAFSGWILATGVMMLSAVRENDRTRSRMVGAMFVPLLPAVVLEVARYPGQVDWSHAGVYGGLAVLVAIFVLGLGLALGDWRRVLR
ncbi:MAG: hypothetical protein HZC37_07190 [Burkholderiales bacterium]|nr:hypothetical protein [Burkholderiales bacterium]